MKETKIKGNSVWKNGDKKCIVCSERQTKNNVKEDTWKVNFKGWNPFPCYSMSTNIGVLFSWLSSNGWTMMKGGTRVELIRETDDITGKIISEKKSVTDTIP